MRYLRFLFILLIPVLLISVLNAGLKYQYDIDELFHVQLVWFYAHGLVPFRDLFSIHSPVFHYSLIPLFKFFGFNFNSIYRARILISVFYLLRITAVFLITGKIFNFRTALIFVLLYLLDPLSNFVSFQIRPDNLMILFFAFAFFVYVIALRKSQAILFFISAFLFSLSALTSIKIAPSVAIVTFFIMLSERKNTRKIIYFIAGLLLPLLCFSLYFLNLGIFGKMAEQLLFDSQKINNALLNPGKVYFYFKPDNIYLFGVMGKPANWYFLVTFPFLALAGLGILIFRFLKRIPKIILHPELLLALILIFQFVSIFSLYSIYAQYFISLSWLVSVFAAFFLDLLIRKSSSLKFGFIVPIILLILLIPVYRSALTTNRIRSQIDNRNTIKNINRIWSRIPENEYVFPNFLFRPLAYPLTYGAFFGDIPPVITNKFPDITSTLKNHNVKYLLLTEYTLKFLPPKDVKFIEENYKEVSSADSLWVNK